MTGIGSISWKARGRIAGIALLCAGFVSANAGGIAAARPGDQQARAFPSENQHLSIAQHQARSHLDRFFEVVLDANGVARQGAALRIHLRDDDGRNRDVWVTPFARDGSVMMGVAATTTAQDPTAATGQLVTFTTKDVRDWSFVGDDGRMYGNFTTRLLLSAIAPAQTSEIAAVLSDTPLPANW